MVRKISSVILALAILTSGFFAWKRLSYWDRSVMIFKYDLSEQQPGRGIGRGSGRFDGREGREFTDSLRMRIGQHGERPPVPEREMRDTLLMRSREGRFPGGGMQGRGEFRSERQFTGKKINMRSVPWFLAVFASFTLIVIYMEKGIKFIRKKKTDVQIPCEE